jgi:FK506-binding protein 4/5
MQQHIDEGVIKQQVIVDGIGDEKCPKGYIVSIHYIARYASDQQEFDNTYRRNKPEEFLVGVDQVISGVDIAVQTMKKQETSVFLINGAKHGHKVNRKSNRFNFRMDEDLIFEIQVLDWRPDEPLENEWIMPISDKIRIAKNLKEEGNEYFKDNKYLKAFRIYKRALKTLKRMKKSSENVTESEHERTQLNSLKITCLMNLAACCLKLKGREKDCIDYTSEILDKLTEYLTNDQKVKTLYRRAQAYLNLAEFDKARQDLEVARCIAPDNQAVILELKKVQKEESEYTKRLKKMYSNMFSGE